MKSLTALLAWLMLATSATAQIASPENTSYSGETVIDIAGRLVDPWKATKTCATNTSGAPTCRTVVINSRTREVAKLGEKWSSKFAPTGAGQEVRRLEPTIDKAKRLASSPKLKIE